MTDKSLGIAGFLRSVIEALKAAGVEYLIGGTIEGGMGVGRTACKSGSRSGGQDTHQIHQSAFERAREERYARAS